MCKIDEVGQKHKTRVWLEDMFGWRDRYIDDQIVRFGSTTRIKVVNFSPDIGGKPDLSSCRIPQSCHLPVTLNVTFAPWRLR